MSASIENSDRFRHLTGDYYWDTEAVGPLRWLLTAGLLIGFPPAGAFLFGWFAIGAITSSPEDRLDDEVNQQGE